MAKRRISVRDFRGDDVEIEWSDGTVYTVRGDLPMEIVNWMAALEEDSQEQDPNDEDVSFDFLDGGQELLEKLVQESNPNVVLPLPKLSPQELLGTMGALVGGDSVGDAVARAIGDSLGTIGEELKDDDGTAADPLAASPKPKRARAKKQTPKAA
jgi:hypothetical protein